MSRVNLIAAKRVLARIGGVLGLFGGIAFGALRLGLLHIQTGIPLDSSPPFNGELLGGIAFTSAYIFPFALALIALRWNSPAAQAAVWLAASVLAWLGSFTTFSLVGLVVFSLPALLLMAAAGLAWLVAGWRQTVLILPMAMGLMLIGIGAWRILFAREDGRCWNLIRATDGTEHWVSAPFNMTGGPFPADPAPGEPVSGLCSTDIITPLEGALSVGLWTLTLLALKQFLPRWSPVAKDSVSGFIPKTN
jgi:hypothetical protein